MRDINLSFVQMGNGLLAVNTLKEEHGDNEYIAQINDSGEIIYYAGKEQVCGAADKKYINLQRDIWLIRRRFNMIGGVAQNTATLERMDIKTAALYHDEMEKLIKKLP